MTRVIGSLVVKNEADRYLEACLRHMRPLVDELFVWDDQSTDDTVRICKKYTNNVVVRPKHLPSFLEHEGKFRMNAWQFMEAKVKPRFGDWILSFDADEFLVGPTEDTRLYINKAIQRAEYDNASSVILHFPEIFKIDDEGLWQRTDGFWGKINGTRLFKYLPKLAEWPDKAMGCGSEPSYVATNKKSQSSFGLNMLHLGYAREEDQINKHSRYSELIDHGHNNSHIQSIIQTPLLELWDGEVPVYE